MILGTEDNTKEIIPSEAQIEVLFHLIINIKENQFLFLSSVRIIHYRLLKGYEPRVLSKTHVHRIC